RTARDDIDSSGLRMEPESDLERGRQVELDRNADDVGGRLVPLHFLFVDGHEHDGKTREDLIAKLQRELARRPESPHHEIDLLARVFLPKEVGQKPPALYAREA